LHDSAFLVDLLRYLPVEEPVQQALLSGDHVLSDAHRFFERPEDAWMLERDSVMRVLAERGWTT